MELDRDTLLKLYRTMTTIRHFEERGVPETGQRGMSSSVHSSVGQEAVPTGVCAHLSDDDYIGSTHRGHGHCIAKGVDPKLMMAELFGRSHGPNKGKGGSMHIADMSKGMLGTNGIVAGSVPLAVGAAFTSKIQQAGPRRRGLLRRRRRQPGRPPRVHEPGLRVETARHFLLREQRLRRVHAG